jgi:hypothetical protein
MGPSEIILWVEFRKAIGSAGMDCLYQGYFKAPRADSDDCRKSPTFFPMAGEFERLGLFSTVVATSIELQLKYAA